MNGYCSQKGDSIAHIDASFRVKRALIVFFHWFVMDRVLILLKCNLIGTERELYTENIQNQKIYQLTIRRIKGRAACSVCMFHASLHTQTIFIEHY